MKKIFKRITSSALALSIVCSANISANALESYSLIGDTTTEISEQEYIEFVEYSIQKHLVVQDILTDSPVEYSNPIPYYNISTQEITGSIILVMSDDKVIGKMSVCYDDGTFSSDFDTTVNNVIQSAVSDDLEIAFGGQNNSEFFYSENEGWSYVDGIDMQTIPSYSPSVAETVTVAGSCNISYIMPRSIATYNLGVNRVANSTTYNSAGQCWASCVAMVVNFKDSDTLTSDDVYEDLTDAEIDFSSNGTALALDYYDYSYTETDSSMTSGDVTTALMNRKPVIMHIKNSSNDRHAIVIKGIVLDATSSTYTILDPNKSTTITKVVSGNPNASQYNFSFTSAGVSFTKWYNSFY